MSAMDSSGSKAPILGSDFLLYLLPILHSKSELLSPLLVVLSCSLLALALVSILRWTSRGGCAWGDLLRFNTIPGPRGFPIIGSLLQMGGLAHRRLAQLAVVHKAERLMSLSLGSTRLVIASKPEVAREILNSSAFADRPLKQSAQQLMFGRAIGFAPYGDYWRGLRRIAANHLFSPKQIVSQEPLRQRNADAMLASISEVSREGKSFQIRGFLQHASLANIMQSVFGQSIGEGGDFRGSEQLQEMVQEGFELLGAFNWSDHLPWLRFFADPHSIQERCDRLVPRVHSFVQRIIEQHRASSNQPGSSPRPRDFVDVLLSLGAEEKLQDEDMIAVLWEMIFRGTDTTAILTEWVLAELVLHPDIQSRLHQEINSVASASPGSGLSESEITRLPLLQAVIKETLRMHPPGPLLSWARLATHDVSVDGHLIPAGTTAMVNMWSITHDSTIWGNPETFNPDRFLEQESLREFDIKGSDLRLAPFGAGRRVCPGRALGLATVGLWLGRLLQRFEFVADGDQPVDLGEVLKLSCEMATPLRVRAVERL